FSAIAMEIAAGLAFHSTCRLWSEMPANAADLRQKQATLSTRRIQLVERIETLQQEPEEFVNRFWRNFHARKLRGTAGSSFTKIWMIAIFFLLPALGMPRAHAAAPLH